MPKLSIIIPVYNTEKYLDKCISSILQQDFTDYELWLIDDGSQDSSIEIIKRYAASDLRIHTAFIHGKGPAEPRNYGLRHATGDYVLFVDSDDYLTPKALSHLINYAEQYPDADFIKGNQFILVGEDEKNSVFASFREPYANSYVSPDEMISNVLKTDFVPTNNLIKRSVLSNYPPPHTSHGACAECLEFHEELVLLEDVPFIIEAVSRSKSTAYLTTETYVYRLESETSLTRSKRTLAKCMSLAIVSEYCRKLASSFIGDANMLITSRAVEMSVTALFQACTYLNAEESKIVFTQVRSNYPRFPFVGRSLKHKFGIIAYNISPALLRRGLLSLRKFLISEQYR